MIKHRIKNRTYLYLRCVCGETFIVREDSWKRGDTKSCGCYRRNYMRKKMTGKSPPNKSHNESKPRSIEYRAWSHIKTRCLNKKCKDYYLYGDRGIKVCKRWKDYYENFLKDMGRRPANCTSIDRINNNGDYKPSNCRWADNFTQARNKRNVARKI